MPPESAGDNLEEEGSDSDCLAKAVHPAQAREQETVSNACLEETSPDTELRPSRSAETEHTLQGDPGEVGETQNTTSQDH